MSKTNSVRADLLGVVLIQLRWHAGCQPRYMSPDSSCCDLYAREALTIAPQERKLVPVGVWITGVDHADVPKGMIPELQIRARSSLAFRQGLMLANGVGTVDADYRDELKVPLVNMSDQTFEIEKGMRVAQLAMNLIHRIPCVGVEGAVRKGGFGSTGLGAEC